jgi:hypothetical protein
MFAGYNTNISHNNKIYHIQTEDTGQGDSVIVTRLYSEGRIVASKKIAYAHVIDDQTFELKVKTMMKDQHELMINELMSGKYAGENS